MGPAQDPRKRRKRARGAETAFPGHSGPIRGDRGESEAHRATESAKPEGGRGRGTPENGPSRAARLWAGASPVPLDPEHPARRWAATKEQHPLWPDREPWPDSVRWIERQRARAREATPGGSLVACFAPLTEWTGPHPPAPCGVQLVHVAADGQPRKDRGGLGKRSHGSLSGAACLIGGPLHTAERVHVAEGIADALAVAARRLLAALTRRGIVGAVRTHPPGCDPAQPTR